MNNLTIKEARFFDIDTLIRVDNSVWIVSKSKPSIPIIKITQSEFNLIKKGVYRKYESMLNINGVGYWLPENLLSELKIKSKKHNIDISNLSFSMQEFTNKDVIKNLDFQILVEHFQDLKNKVEDIYVICSKRSKTSYEPIITRLESELERLGLKIKKFYFLSETFFNRKDDEIAHKKVRLLLQHLIGLKTDVDKFTDEELHKYDLIYYYDDEPKAISLAHNSNNLFYSLLSNSEDSIRERIKNILKSNDNSIIVKMVTHNKVNLFNDKEVLIEFSHIKKTFESFLIIESFKK
jgi:hypothetical protein